MYSSILINDLDIHKNIVEWQKFISYVPQTSFLINDTIKNMTGKPEFDPITNKLYKSLNPESQLAIDLRKLQQRKRALLLN